MDTRTHTNDADKGVLCNPPRIFSDPTTPNAVEHKTRARNAVEKHKKGPDMGFEPRGGGEEEEESRRGGEVKKRRGRRGGRARFGYVFFFSYASFLLLLQPPSKSSVRACVAVRS